MSEGIACETEGMRRLGGEAGIGITSEGEGERADNVREREQRP